MRRISDFIPSPSIIKDMLGRGDGMCINYFNNPPKLYINEVDTSIGKCTPYILGRAINLETTDIHTTKNFVCPLFINPSRHEHGSTASALDEFLNVRYTNELNEVTFDGKVYYGNRWIILDKNYNIIYMICFINRNTYTTDVIYMISGDFIFEKSKLSKAFNSKLVPEIISLGSKVLIGDLNIRKTITNYTDMLPQLSFNTTKGDVFSYVNDILRASIMEIVND